MTLWLGWIKTRTRAKSEDMIAFVPSICPSVDHSQFALIQTLVKTAAKPVKTHSLAILYLTVSNIQSNHNPYFVQYYFSLFASVSFTLIKVSQMSV